MKIYDAQIAKKNILNFFKKSGITIEDFANILGTSDRWIKYVQANKKYRKQQKVRSKSTRMHRPEHADPLIPDLFWYPMMF